MKAACSGDWVNTTKTKIDNFNKQRRLHRHRHEFTKDSLNSGFLAMAEKLDLCDINKVADRMGVKTGDGQLTYESNPEAGYTANVAVRRARLEEHRAARDGRRLRHRRQQGHLLHAEGDRPRDGCERPGDRPAGSPPAPR